LEEAFKLFVAQVEDLYRPLSDKKPEPSRLDAIRGEIADLGKQIFKYQTLIDAQDNPADATSLSRMLTDCDKRKAAKQEELEKETIHEKGTPKLDNAYVDYIKSLMAGRQTLDQRMRLREAIRGAVERITVNLETKECEIRWKKLDETFTISVTNRGYRTKGLGGIEIAEIL
jgi:hypothetical protein